MRGESVRGKPVELADALRGSITDLAPHEPLRGQRDLAEEFGVSLMTVRHALAQLQDEGLIYTVHGVGSFVADRLISRRMVLASFTEEMRSRGLEPQTAVKDIAVIEAPAAVREALRLDEGSPVYRIVRLRRASGEPIALETAHVDAEAFPGLMDCDLTGSLYEIMRQTYARQISSADERLSAAVLRPQEALMLGVKSGSAALQIDRTVYDTRGRAMETSTSLRRSDRYDVRYVIHV
jgi:GntR family transcriptional regulator